MANDISRQDLLVAAYVVHMTAGNRLTLEQFMDRVCDVALVASGTPPVRLSDLKVNGVVEPSAPSPAE